MNKPTCCLDKLSLFLQGGLVLLDGPATGTISVMTNDRWTNIPLASREQKNTFFSMQKNIQCAGAI